jgi:hypothetical protein
VLKLKYDGPLSSSAFKLNLRRYIKELYEGDVVEEEVIVKWGADPKAVGPHPPAHSTCCPHRPSSTKRLGR